MTRRRPIEDRLRASVRTGAYDGDLERAICAQHMIEAADAIMELRKRIQELEGRLRYVLERIEYMDLRGPDVLSLRSAILRIRDSVAETLRIPTKGRGNDSM